MFDKFQNIESDKSLLWMEAYNLWKKLLKM